MTVTDALAGPRPSEWGALLAAACTGRSVRSVYQPIVDLARGTVVGYEALTRFGELPHLGPDRWFAAARARGCHGELEAVALRTALAARPDLPVNCFLTVNVSPDLLASDPVRAVWADEGDLGGLVVELTEQAPIESYAELEGDLDRLRAAGAMIAVDDAGAGYAGLRHLLALRPAIIKLDRALVENVDRDAAKLALIEMIGTFAGRVDAWLLAEGIERQGELDTLAALGVPLAQGYYLSRPAPPWAQLPADIALRLLTRATAGTTRTVRDVLEQVPTAEPGRAVPLLVAGSDEVVVLVDEDARPLGVLGGGPAATRRDDLRVHLDTPITDTLLRAVTRDPSRRWNPVLCTDSAGRLLGIARVERLIRAALA